MLPQLMDGLNAELLVKHAVEVVNPFDIFEDLIIAGDAEGITADSTACCQDGPFKASVRCGPNDSTLVCDDDVYLLEYFSPPSPVGVYLKTLPSLCGMDTAPLFSQYINLKSLAQL
ncbi:unnamed protein product [Calypogeia fissa]